MAKIDHLRRTSTLALRRLRRGLRPRFFDVVVADAWYATGPFLRTVVEGNWAGR